MTTISSVEAVNREANVLRWLPVGMIWSCLVLLPFGRLVEVPVLLMAAAGIVLIVRQRTMLLAKPSVRTFCWVFAAMWLPILISLVDAVSPERTTVIAVNHLRFFFSGVFMAWALSDAWARDRLLTLSGWLLVFWLVDAGVQMVLGFDLIGREPFGVYVSGLYGSESLKLGTTLGVIAPLLWVFIQRRYSPWLLLVVMLASAYVVMSAGSRAGWVSMLVCVFVFAYINRDYIRRIGRRVLVSGVILAVLLTALAYATSPGFKGRVDQSITDFSGREAFVISSLGHREYIWKGAFSMIGANPINGVGARGFRYAFPDYAESDDPFIAENPLNLPMHSHQLLLEIAAETGLVGLAGLLLAMAVLVRGTWTAPAQVRAGVTPYGIALCAAFFPLNTHLAIYSAHWSQIVWWLIGVYCAYLGTPRTHTPSASQSIT